MLALAFKMLIGNRAACIGVIFGIFLATLLISQQSAIFLGLLSRSYRMVTDVPSPNIWIMDPATQSDDKVRGMPLGYLDIVRSVPGVEWAVPIRLTMPPLVTSSGIFEVCLLYGIDDATLIGAPTSLVEGNIKDLHREGGVIVDTYSAHESLAVKLPDGSSRPLKIGDQLEINDHHAVVVGISKITRGFYPQPIIFTTNSTFTRLIPSSASQIGFIIAHSQPKFPLEDVVKNINANPRMLALTRTEFENRIVTTFLKTGILINFGLSVALGVIIGFSIAGQIFYQMTIENLVYFALIKAIGGNRKMLLQMITVQAVIVGLTGFILGISATLLWGIAVRDTTLAFLFPWQLLLFTGLIIILICLSTALLSIHKVLKVDPKVLMGN